MLIFTVGIRKLNCELMWGVSYLTASDLEHRFSALLKSLTTSKMALRDIRTWTAWDQLPVNVTGLAKTLVVLSKDDITPSVSVPSCPHAAKDPGLPEAFWRIN